MFSTVEMSRLTMAGSAEGLDQALRLCADLGNVHISPYSGNEAGFSVGTPHPDADEISAMLVKVRSAAHSLECQNRDGPVSLSSIKKALKGDFSSKLDSILSSISKQSDALTEIARLEERVTILKTIAPLNIPLDLMTGISAVDVYLAQTPKASKAMDKFSDLLKYIEIHIADDVIAVACQGLQAAEVQMVMGEMGAKPIQIPSGEGKPSQLLKEAQTEIASLKATIAASDSKQESWDSANGRMLLAIQEHLERETEILTGHNLCATSAHAFALEAWLPTESADKARSVLSKASSHLTIEEFVEAHGHGHDDEHETEYPPIEYDNPSFTAHASLLTNLVGRPKYGTIDTTSMIAFTFPIFYGLILGDAGYGLCIMALAYFLKGKIGHQPTGAIASRILMNMGIATLVVGILTAEAFGFIIQDWAAFAWFYEPLHHSTVNLLTGTIFESLFGLSHTYLPFHRASGALTDYILLAVYIGCAHLLLGFTIGFINVFRAHGPVAAFFEKGSWIMILIGGAAHILRFLTDDTYGTFEGSIWSAMIVIGIICLIYGLAVYEGFGWLGGIIMGPIETFGLLANTLSYLRIMAVGVAGVKIAEVGNEMGFHAMTEAASSGDYLLIIPLLLLWIGVQVFALALGLLSPSIHAIRLHFVEWMGKFHDGSGEEFSPLGGRPLHVEGQTS